MPSPNNTAIDNLFDSEQMEDDAIIEDYKKLNEKCDSVISKIKKRKSKIKIKNS